MSNKLIEYISSLNGKDKEWDKLYWHVWKQYSVDKFDMDKQAKKDYKKRTKTRELSEFQIGILIASSIVVGGVLGVFIKILIS